MTDDLEAKIAEAARKGDFAEARRLIEEAEAEAKPKTSGRGGPKKAKPKPKAEPAKPKKAAPKKKAPAKAKAKAKAEGGAKPAEPGPEIIRPLDNGGGRQTPARRMSVAGQPFVNNFKATDYRDTLTPAERKADKAKAKADPSRPRRQAAQLIDVRCKRCNQPFRVYPSALSPVTESDGGIVRTAHVYYCGCGA